ncbi:MAG TPA: hypothetical protein VL137_00840 [Polyangiaceae bacterium]|nr:hypothetical protein [Polyangiaceae bacterium]
MDQETSAGQAIADAITELDVHRARALLAAQKISSNEMTFQRVRLAIEMSDCDSAEATARTLPASPAVNALADLAQNCSRAMAGAQIVEDKARGVWVRMQDEADKVLLPLIFDVAAKARDAIARDLGVELPRPLRIELVQDLFSLSAISGLPLKAAETTGTVAVARWGRVTMLSPRAAPLGYPWQDTLAHEIAHLGLTRATRDFAPLWLQEGIAKNAEVRWRPARLLDDRINADSVALQALITGESVGVEGLGQSIALLPSADAASIAFAEVKSFMAYFIATLGRPAFRLLLADLRGIGKRDPNPALVSVTGFELQYWIAQWQNWLLTPSKDKPLPKDKPPAPAPMPVAGASDDPFEFARNARLGALFFEAERFRLAAEQFDQALKYDSDQVTLRFDAARSWLAQSKDEQAQSDLGDLAGISQLHGGWLALHGRFLRQHGDDAAANASFDLAVAVDPFNPEAACEGQSKVLRHGQPKAPPRDAVRREICRAVDGVD